MKRSRRAAIPVGSQCRAHLLEISQYLDGELPARRRASLERHMASCPCCAGMAHRLRTVVAVTKAQRKSAPKEVRARATQRVRQLLSSRKARRPLR